MSHCAIPGCPSPHKARGYCIKHWQRWRRTGDPLTVRKPIGKRSERALAELHALAELGATVRQATAILHIADETARRWAAEIGVTLRAPDADERRLSRVRRRIRIAEVQRMVKEGLSRGQIAEALGVTRNVVIGICWRLGLRAEPRVLTNAPTVPKVKAAPKPPPAPSGNSRNFAAVNAVARSEKLALSPGLPLTRPDPAPWGGAPVLIEALRSGVCHWPLWAHDENPATDEAFYCGAPTDCAESYCATHFRKSRRGDSALTGRARPDQRLRLLKRHSADARDVA